MDLLFLLAACTSSEPSTDGRTHETEPEDTGRAPTHSGGGTTLDSAHSGGGHSADDHTGVLTTYGGFDCEAEPPPGPFVATSTRVVRTEEDFDFDGTGYLLTQRNLALAGITRNGNVTILVGNIGTDAAGIRSLPTGHVLVAQPDGGNVRRVDVSRGTAELVLSGLVAPNGLEAGRDGAAYVTELTSSGRVVQFDPFTGDSRVLARLEYPNGVVLSPDEETLYVVEGAAFGRSTVVAFDRDGSGWGPRRVVHSAQALLGGITVDHCGDLYLVEYSTGRVYRVRIPEGTIDPLADLGSAYPAYSSAHFSPGFGGWSTTELYVSNRAFFYVIPVGVEGRHILR